MWGELPIAALICGRSEELDLSAVNLVRRCGYQNVSKGLRRLERNSARATLQEARPSFTLCLLHWK